MERQLQLPPFASISPQRRLSSSRSHEPYRYNSYDSVCTEYSQESLSEYPGMNNWVRECSPMSTASTTGGCDEEVMLPYTEAFPLPLQHLADSTENATNYAAWPVQHYHDGSAWSYHMNVPTMTGGGYAGYQPLAAGSWVSSVTPSGSDDTHSVAGDPNAWETDDSDSESESDRNRLPSAATILQLGRWSVGNNAYVQSERQWVCPDYGRPDPTGRICNKAFMRIEHLRRHYNTVHHPQKNHHCKVPRCEKKFSRGDNLRDHYWTHLARGGRAGKNDKMSMERLIAILGPNERKLVRKLKLKLRAHWEKQHAVIRAKL